MPPDGIEPLEPPAPDRLVGALQSGLRVLRYLCSRDTPVGVNQIARELGINPSTCFQLLKTLVHERLAVFDPNSKMYGASLGVVELAQGRLTRDAFIPLARPFLESLATGFGVTAALFRPVQGRRVVLVDFAEARSAVRIHMPIGQRMPMLLGAFGRCFAAKLNLPRPELRAEFRTLRWQDPPSFETYCAEVSAARRDGFAVDRGNYVRGVCISAALVEGERGEAVAAISCVGLSAQLDEPQLHALTANLRDAARQVSQALSGRFG
ncbi:IclR family transcriptional regulator [Roseomonas terrae]|uniref:IclR family transcriptional regulator n=1 Tax=Neoroseomonas terrae TaxID=424799 RepID=A0ABS5EQ79_9PROT|nr:IclR family transcriptional regulator [Neoroseomonas terrae]MBR0653174.1 IclR family transcriptional regulator [Neoroseomonas terrae]